MQKPLIIGTWTSSGNSSKTTLLFLLAWFMAAVKGLKVKVWCADPEHSSMVSWLNKLTDEQDKPEPRFGPAPFDYDSAPAADQLWRKIKNDLDNYDVIMIDVGGGHEKLAKAVAAFATIMLMVSNESLLEDEKLDSAIDAMTEAAKDHNRPDLKRALIMTRMAPNARRMIERLQDKYSGLSSRSRRDNKRTIAVFDNAFPMRKSYLNVGRRHPDQVSELDLSPDSEIARIYDELIDYTQET